MVLILIIIYATCGPAWLWNLLTIRSYIVDWEDWTEATSRDTWHDTEYIRWNLARKPKRDYDDMSTWVL